MLETRFRDRWSVARCADELKTGADRLQHPCTEKFGRTPCEVINERTDFEGNALLQNAPVPVSDVSNRLGFSYPSHFSRVFARLNGESPPTCRQRGHRSLETGRVAPINFSDWP